jgi:hypothetical protein
MIETGVINLDGEYKVALVFGQMNKPLVPVLVSLTIAENFRDEEGQDVLLFIDSIFRFTQAGSEVFATSVVSPRPLVTNPRCPLIWVGCKYFIVVLASEVLIVKQARAYYHNKGGMSHFSAGCLHPD